MHVWSSCVPIKYHVLEILSSLLINVPMYESNLPLHDLIITWLWFLRLAEIIAIQQWSDVFQ